MMTSIIFLRNLSMGVRQIAFSKKTNDIEIHYTTVDKVGNVE